MQVTCIAMLLLLSVERLMIQQDASVNAGNWYECWSKCMKVGDKVWRRSGRTGTGPGWGSGMGRGYGGGGVGRGGGGMGRCRRRGGGRCVEGGVSVLTTCACGGLCHHRRGRWCGSSQWAAMHRMLPEWCAAESPSLPCSRARTPSHGMAAAPACTQRHSHVAPVHKSSTNLGRD